MLDRTTPEQLSGNCSKRYYCIFNYYNYVSHNSCNFSEIYFTKIATIMCLNVVITSNTSVW